VAFPLEKPICVVDAASATCTTWKLTPVTRLGAVHDHVTVSPAFMAKLLLLQAYPVPSAILFQINFY
jgi:hypothetical protein